MKCAQDNIRRHALLDEESRKRLPALGAQDRKGVDAVAEVKFFSAFGRYTFYATEFDGEDTLFGYCVSALGPDCDEWCYGSLRELAETKVFGKVPAIERDLYWTPKPVGECEGVS